MQWKVWAVAAVAMVASAASQAATQEIDFGKQAASSDARRLAKWIADSGDAAGKPFAIVDKKSARLHLFDAAHHLVGSSTVLLGQTVGDDITPGVGERAQLGQVRADERTTPAGRFETEPGTNLQGQSLVWLDYQAAFAIHPVERDRQYANRLARLRSTSLRDNRASLGCVVVPVHFYRQRLQPVLGQGRAVVYVLPESPASTLQAAMQEPRRSLALASDRGG